MLEKIDQWIMQWIMGLSKFEVGLLIYFYILTFLWVWTSDEEKKPSEPDTTGVSNPEQGTTRVPNPGPDSSLPIGPDPTIKPFRPSIFTPPKNYQLAVNKKRFIVEVIRWGLSNIPYEGLTTRRTKNVNVEISYYKHKKNNGVYSSSEKKIKVYVNTHSKIDELIDSSIHELCHHFQYCADPRNFQSRYKRLLYLHQYRNHPMEIEARNMAAKYVNPCFKYLVEKGYLKSAA
jgi:hypothetical protein